MITLNWRQIWAEFDEWYEWRLDEYDTTSSEQQQGKIEELVNKAIKEAAKDGD